MIVLGIESSCDDTGVALVEDGTRIIASEVASQVARHAEFGGVVPEIAAREHLLAIEPLYQGVLQKAQISLPDVDLIAVTQGPGLIGSLLVGLSFAKALALKSGKPLIPVNHVHAHVHGALLDLPQSTSLEELFPCLALVVSGGHLNLYYMKEVNRFRLLASTIDDACGECFDKVAKLLDLGYPGGGPLERLAQAGDPLHFPMPTMMAASQDLDFSYSGLKTHVVQLIRKITNHGKDPLSPETKAHLAAAFQEEALSQIVRKLKTALQNHPDSKNILIAGGVASNQRFRELLSSLDTPAIFPPPAYCVDNGAMIAASGWHEWQSLVQAEPDFSLDQLKRFEWDGFSRYDFLATRAA